MNEIQEKLEKLQALTSELDSHVWKIFSIYRGIEGINFNDPRGWEVVGDYIRFNGYDGCMGCYDNMSIDIPLKYFGNPDAEFEALKNRHASEAAAKIQAAKDHEAEVALKREEHDRQEFERLKKKFTPPAF